jgi:HKD family nuclease
MSLTIRHICNSDGAGIGAVLENLIRNYDRAFFAVAYGTHSAIKRLDRQGSLTGFLRRGARLRTVFDIDRHFTDPDIIDELCTIPGDSECRLYGPRLRRPSPPDFASAFHPKVYYFEAKKNACAVVGSANLSIGGISKNEEAATFIEGRTDDDYFHNLRDYLDRIWDSDCLIAVDQYSTFREEYARVYKAARQTLTQTGIVDDAPLPQFDNERRKLARAFKGARKNVYNSLVGYLCGLLSGGFVRHTDEDGPNVLRFRLRRGKLNKGHSFEGMIHFPEISEHQLSQVECVHRDAERIADRIRNALFELGGRDGVSFRQSGKSKLVYEFTVRFQSDSRIWLELCRIYPWAGTWEKYRLPAKLNFRQPEIRRSFLQGYMDIRTRFSKTDALPPPTPYMRIAVSVGGEAVDFALRLRKMLA